MKRYILKHSLRDLDFCWVSIVDKTNWETMQSILVPILNYSLDQEHKPFIELRETLLIMNKVNDDDLLYLSEVKNYATSIR